MAKSVKVRKKKSNSIDIKKKNIMTILNYCYYRTRFIGDCFHEPRAMGIQKLWTNLIGEDHNLGMKYYLHHLSREMNWGIGLVCYFKDPFDNNKIHAIQTCSLLESFILEEVSENLSSIIIEGINRTLDLDDIYNNNNFIYYAYLIIPEFNEDLFTITDNFSNLMINLDDISDFEPFKDNLPGRPSHSNTLFEAIKNNGVYPKSEQTFYKESEIIDLEGTNLHEALL